MSLQSVAFLLGFLFLFSCGNNRSDGIQDAAQTNGSETMLSDPEATPLARALFTNLMEIAPDHVLLGHQDALAYGMGWKGEPFRTDINDVTGDHPALFGWDLGHMGDPENIDGVPFGDMKKWAIAAFEKGGINTFSWHMRNYAIGGSSWDTGSGAGAYLPGGEFHGPYIEKLNQVADFFSSLRTGNGELIPVVFRPFHEMTGGWFWWGTKATTTEQYRELFRFTVDYLRKEKGLHQLIIAYSTDRFDSPDIYLKYYPGDEYVDVMGFDDYWGLRTAESSIQTIRMLEMVDSISAAHGKLMAITETGYETIPDPEWFTGVVLPVLKKNNATRRTAWILFWRNGRPDHFYAPYPGHPSAADFTEFMRDPLMVSLSGLPDMYKTN